MSDDLGRELSAGRACESDSIGAGKLLIEAAAKFRFYEAQHREKGEIKLVSDNFDDCVQYLNGDA